jgi:hypothetical protein
MSQHNDSFLSEREDAHNFLDGLIEEYGYSPKLSDSAAIRLIFDLAHQSNAIYRKLRSSFGKPDKEANPEHYEEFYTRLRAEMRNVFSVENDQYIPFVPSEVSFEFDKAMVTRNRSEIEKVAEKAARVYHADPRSFDAFAVAARYIEGMK